MDTFRITAEHDSSSYLAYMLYFKNPYLYSFPTSGNFEIGLNMWRRAGKNARGGKRHES